MNGIAGPRPFGCRAALGRLLSGNGLVFLSDSSGAAFNTGETITGAGAGAVLRNAGNTISGYGKLGAGGMALANEAKGTVAAVGGAVFVDTGTLTIANARLFEALGGTLDLLSNLDATGGGTFAALRKRAISGVILLDGIAVAGGTIVTDAADPGSVLTVTAKGGTLDGGKSAVTIGNGAQVLDYQGSALTLAGAVVNSGTVAVTGNARSASDRRLLSAER